MADIVLQISRDPQRVKPWKLTTVVFSLPKRSGPHIPENCIQWLTFLHISRDWWWSNSWYLVYWPCLILWTFSTVWIFIYTLRFWKKKKPKLGREWARNTIHPPLFFFPLLSTCIQWWAVGNKGIASTSLHHLEAAKHLYPQNLYPI